MFVVRVREGTVILRDECKKDTHGLWAQKIVRCMEDAALLKGKYVCIPNILRNFYFSLKRKLDFDVF